VADQTGHTVYSQIPCTGLLQMIVRVLTTYHTQYT